MSAAPRIASLLSSATEILFALGAGDRVVAIGHECDWPPEAITRPRATFSRISASATSRAIDDQVRELSAAGEPLYGIDAELLGRLAPEWIVTQVQCDVCAIRYADVLAVVAADSRLAGTQVLALGPTSLADILADVHRVGEAIDCSAEAKLYATSLQARIDMVRGRTAKLPHDRRPRVACIEWVEPLMLAANWVPELVELAGGRNGLSRGGQHSIYHDWQDLVAYDPEVILVSPCGFDLVRTKQESQLLRERPHWQNLTAVRTGRVFDVDGNAYLNRSGPRIVDSLEILAHAIHPELFSPPAGAWAASL